MVEKKVRGGPKADTDKESVKAGPAPAPAAAEPAVGTTDDTELAAVIAAAIAASEGTSTAGFVVKSIK